METKVSCGFQFCAFQTPDINFPYFVASQNYATALMMFFIIFAKQLQIVTWYPTYINQSIKGCCTTTHSSSDLCNLPQHTAGSVVYAPKNNHRLVHQLLSISEQPWCFSITGTSGFKARKQKQFQLYTQALVVYTHLTSRSTFFPLCPTQMDAAVEQDHAFTSIKAGSSSGWSLLGQQHFHYLLCSVHWLQQVDLISFYLKKSSFEHSSLLRLFLDDWMLHLLKGYVKKGMI